ncbi:signal peptide peptidase SppA, partial [Pseudomaricurvus sp.]|uniref:signal peptide peptidase SppA n=1 Tax=Pseudomaricurvus sp. TaxID=2004510 RepID=UPI003F6C3C35
MSARKPGFIRRFFSAIWSILTWIRTSIANLLILLVILIIVVALLPKEAQQMPDEIALRVAPSGFLVDQYSYVDPVTQLLQQTSDEKAETLVKDVIKAIESGADDQRITSMVLDLNHLMGGGLSKLEEIGTALQRFKDSGKAIYAISDNYTQEQYYLASYADEVLMHPMGNLILTGYGSYRNYFKSALDKLHLKMHIFRVGEYKDAVEPYVRDDMSEASREHNSQWLNELWATYTSTVEQQRQLAEGDIDEFINNMDDRLAEHGGDTAATAAAMHLVDQLASHGQQNQFLISKVGKQRDSEEYRAIDFEDYLDFIPKPTAIGSDKVGLLIAKGMILDGEQPEGTIGGETLSKLIRQAREDKSIKALVLRVDSGGGSAFASELIRQELDITRQQGIPVLVSMGSVAASGGYWIAMGADEIWATPTTITGSIGVFSAFPTLEESLAEIGISTDGIGTTDLAGALRMDRPLSPLAANVLQQSVNNIYQRFLHIVAENRQTTTAQVNAVGQGRVWTGLAAKDLGLVDELGNLQDTIAAAAEKAGLKEYKVLDIEKQLTPRERLAKQLAGELASITPHSVS